MNLEKVVFGFFIIFACTLNFGFFLGDISQPVYHHPGELFATVLVNLVATVLKFGDRTQLGTTHLATSLVAVFNCLLRLSSGSRMCMSVVCRWTERPWRPLCR